MSYPWYQEHGLHQDYDVLWTFDFGEYQLGPNSNVRFEDIRKHIHNDHATTGGSVLGEDRFNIILIHDHVGTEEFHKGYFKELIDYVTERGVTFVTPEFECG